MTFTDGIAGFTLKHGETATATGLPAGVTYTVIEEEAGQDGYRTSAAGDTGRISSVGTAHAYFANYRDDTGDKSGSLSVSKTVGGNTGDRDKAFHFTVTLSDKSINGVYGDMTFTDGIAGFTLKHGETVTATGLPAGILYTVTEEEAGQDGYKTESEDATGIITEETPAKRLSSIPGISRRMNRIRGYAGYTG